MEMWTRYARSSSAAQTSSLWKTLSTGGRLYTGLHTSARYIMELISKQHAQLNVTVCASVFVTLLKDERYRVSMK